MIGSRLKLLRKRLGKSQADMAQALGAGRASYQRYERDERALPAAIVERARVSFGVSLDWLWDGKGEMFVAAGDPWAASAPSHERLRLIEAVRHAVGRELTPEEILRLFDFLAQAGVPK